MKTFLGGLVIALALMAVGWFAAGASQISQNDANRDRANVRIEDNSFNNARPGAEDPSLHRH